ncbi:cobalamin-independent methionine synthase II family protein [Rosenbergiella australiborealis]|uniref:Cobalamin-independent methionine synthase II family protein n=1 Tax=Rosenbergiella australiborealis TaxID=1544696 RepID=A0ABS5T983_9GAMM|nr:cobalamin-independent methionine synthase II family protein [Rosenbergiella australiborealis]MBT0728070.1 cobalamin-independent methionine synthase II family protein [Rosenbergiella australiborealis]
MQQESYRVEVVGSFLRPENVKQARAQFAQGQITAEQLRETEDQAIREVVALQQQHGLRVVTDGEFRRAWWHFDFFDGLTGVEQVVVEQGIQFNGIQTKAHGIKVTGKIDFISHPMPADFAFLQKIAGHSIAKMTIPSPSVLHFRGGRDAISKTVYPDLTEYFEDIALTWKKAIRAFYQVGCRYLQLDDTAWAYLCSEAQQQQLRARGDDPTQLARTYAYVLNRALEDKPADMRIGLHVCRGNFRSTWISEGGYEPVAEILFGQVNVDTFFLEYDNDRSGGFEPLRYIKPGHQQVVLGLVTTKVGDLESVEQITARVKEATTFISLDQICISPQCGFASTEEGNNLFEAQQWEKIDLLQEVAHHIWP